MNYQEKLYKIFQSSIDKKINHSTMKVIIIKSSDCDSELAKKTFEVLNQIQGKLEFELIGNDGYVVKDIKSHNEIFDINIKFRKKHRVNPDNFMVLLTKTSYNNWFSAFDGNNIYVRTDEWERYTEVPAEYSIAYSIAENILQTLMGLDINNIDWNYIHREPIACVNDFCGLKRDIIRKIQSAAICPTCLEKIKFDRVDKFVLKHLVAIFDTIRKVFRDFEYGIADVDDEEDISNTLLELDRYGLHVRKEGNNQREYTINLSPAELTFYVFLLLHTNGIRKNDINTNEIELITRLYALYTKGRLDKNPFKNLIIESTSTSDLFAQYRYHANKKIKQTKLTDEYLIQSNEKRNLIAFNRTLFICKDETIINIIESARRLGLRIN